MSDSPPEPLDPRRWLSALADGDAEAAERACALWARDASARQTWHRYHLIGDVLRSEDLAHGAAHDARFVAELRERLAQEPMRAASDADADGMLSMPAGTPPPPAQARPSASRRERLRWLVPAAAAAGFAAVAGMLVLTRTAAPDAGSAVPLAGATPGAAVALGAPTGGSLLQAAVGVSAAAAPGAIGAGAPGASMIRDPRLDEYLRAYREGRLSLPESAIGARPVDNPHPRR